MAHKVVNPSWSQDVNDVVITMCGEMDNRMTRMEETLSKIEGMLAGKGAKDPHDHNTEEVQEPKGCVGIMFLG